MNRSKIKSNQERKKAKDNNQKRFVKHTYKESRACLVDQDGASFLLEGETWP